VIGTRAGWLDGWNMIAVLPDLPDLAVVPDPPDPPVLTNPPDPPDPPVFLCPLSAC
jgi:hypothetical protein